MEILGQIEAELQKDLLDFVKVQEETPLPHTVGNALIADILKKIISGDARLSGCATSCETKRMYLEISFYKDKTT